MKMIRKLAIMESLDAMDQIQMEKVLQYIKLVLQQDQANDNRQFRQQAMEQIRRALRNEKGLKMSA